MGVLTGILLISALRLLALSLVGSTINEDGVEPPELPYTTDLQKAID